MISVKELEVSIQPILQECNVRLYEIRWITDGERILQIAITKEDGTLDLNTCALVSEKISEMLDKADDGNEPYTLEVCSPGAEREIKDLAELDRMEQPYVFIRLKHPIRKAVEFTGTIVENHDGILKLEYRDKAAKRTIEFPKEEIDFIRLAVKI